MSKKKRPEYVKIVCQKTLDMIEEELILSDNEVVVKHSEMPINKRMNTELAEVRKTKNISDYLTKKYQ